MCNLPGPAHTIIVKDPMFDRRMVSLAGIMQQNSVSTILGYGKSNRVRAMDGGHLFALPGVAQIAEFFQLSFSRRALPALSGAYTAEPGA